MPPPDREVGTGRIAPQAGRLDRLAHAAHPQDLQSPGRSKGADAGTMAVRNPRRTASARRRGRCGNLPDLAPQAHLAAGHDRRVERDADGRADDRQADGQVGGRLGQADAADHQREHVGGRQADAEPLLEHRQQQRHPTAVEALRRAARHAGRGRADERLHLDEQRSTPLDRRQHDRARHAAGPVAQEERARVGHRRPALRRSSRTARAPAWGRSGA